MSNTSFAPSNKFLTEKEYGTIFETKIIREKRGRELCLNCGLTKTKHMLIDSLCPCSTAYPWSTYQKRCQIILKKKLKPRIVKSVTLKPIINPKIGDKCWHFSKKEICKINSHVTRDNRVLVNFAKHLNYDAEVKYLFDASKVTPDTKVIILKFKIN